MEDNAQDNGAELARADHETEEQGKRATLEQASRQLGTILDAHRRGEPILAEMAARIDARARDPFGLLD